MGYGLKDKKSICQHCRIAFLSYKLNTKFCSAKCNNESLYLIRDIEKYNARKRVKSVAKERKIRYHSDFNFKMTCVLRARLNQAIKNGHKSGSAIRDLGCSIEDLKKHLESKFEPGMNWDNWSRTGWHIDHRVPLTAFDLSNPEQLKEACKYANLQPLWAKDNIKKGGA